MKRQLIWLIPCISLLISCAIWIADYLRGSTSGNISDYGTTFLTIFFRIIIPLTVACGTMLAGAVIQGIIGLRMTILRRRRAKLAAAAITAAYLLLFILSLIAGSDALSSFVAALSRVPVLFAALGLLYSVGCYREKNK